MCQTSNVEKDYKENMIDDSSNLLSNTKCNYVGCKFKSLVTIKWNDISCNNWLHHICQNEYDCAKYDNAFDSMHSCKKRCRVCVDKIMDKVTKSVVTEDKKFTKRYVTEKSIFIYCLKTKCDKIDFSDDNEEIDDFESNLLSDVKINEFSDETTDQFF